MNMTVDDKGCNLLLRDVNSKIVSVWTAANNYFHHI